MDMRFGQDEKEKPVRRIRTGAAANSPKACAAFCLCRRDVREAVPYEKDRHPSLYKGGAFVLPCEGGAGDRKSVGRHYDGDGRCGWDRETAPQPLRHRLAGDRR